MVIVKAWKWKESPFILQSAKGTKSLYKVMFLSMFVLLRNLSVTFIYTALCNHVFLQMLTGLLSTLICRENHKRTFSELSVYSDGKVYLYDKAQIVCSLGRVDQRSHVPILISNTGSGG